MSSDYLQTNVKLSSTDNNSIRKALSHSRAMPSKDDEADFAKAYKDLSEAEKSAAILEAQLNSLEQKLDDFLAEHDKPAVQKGLINKHDTQSSLSTDSKDITQNFKDS